MTDMLSIAEEAAEQAKFSLVSIDLNTIVFTLINTLIIVLLYFFFLHKPGCKSLDERAKTVNKDMDDAQKAKEEEMCIRDRLIADYEIRLVAVLFKVAKPFFKLLIGRKLLYPAFLTLNFILFRFDYFCRIYLRSLVYLPK